MVRLAAGAATATPCSRSRCSRFRRPRRRRQIRDEAAKLLSRGRQARPRGGRLRSRPALSRRPAVPAGLQARRRTVPHRRRCRQSGSAIRARHHLQGGPRRPKDLSEAAQLLGAGVARRQYRRQVEYAIALFNGTGVAKDESRAPRSCSGRPRATGSADRAEPAGAHSVRRAAACRPIRSRPSNGTSSPRPAAPAIPSSTNSCSQADARRARRGRERRAKIKCAVDATARAALLT